MHVLKEIVVKLINFVSDSSVKIHNESNVNTIAIWIEKGV
jgi:hypothetical protein